jgi:hypothetical protein
VGGYRTSGDYTVMSTYDSPYVYGQIPGQASNTPTTRLAQMNLMKAWFDQAGWSTENFNARAYYCRIFVRFL